MAEDLSPPGGSRSRPANPARGGSGADTGWAVIGTMISGMAVWGGAGWLLDRWLDVRFFAPVGIILGMGLAIYVVVLRYGGAPQPSEAQRSKSDPGGRRSRPHPGEETQKGQR